MADKGQTGIVAKIGIVTAILIAIGALLSEIPGVWKRGEQVWCTIRDTCVAKCPATLDPIQNPDVTRDGTMRSPKLSLYCKDNGGGKLEYSYRLTYNWTGSGGGQGGVQRFTMKLLSDNGTVLEHVDATVDRSKCYYASQGGNDQSREGKLSTPADRIKRMEIELKTAEGGTGRC